MRSSARLGARPSSKQLDDSAMAQSRPLHIDCLRRNSRAPWRMRSSLKSEPRRTAISEFGTFSAGCSAATPRRFHFYFGRAVLRLAQLSPHFEVTASPCIHARSRAFPLVKTAEFGELFYGPEVCRAFRNSRISGVTCRIDSALIAHRLCPQAEIPAVCQIRRATLALGEKYCRPIDVL